MTDKFTEKEYASKRCGAKVKKPLKNALGILTNGGDLSDQELLLQWAELGAELYCNQKDCSYVIGHLRRAKARISDIIQAYLNEAAKCHKPCEVRIKNEKTKA